MNQKDRKNLEATLDHTDRVSELIHYFVSEMLERSRTHDRSKFSQEEFPYFAENVPKLEKLTYGSDEYDEALEDLSPALDHHYDVEDHHPEHYENGVEDMDLFAIVEMICDWMAASERHDDGNIHLSIEQNAARFGYSQEFAQVLHRTATKIQEMDNFSG